MGDCADAHRRWSAKPEPIFVVSARWATINYRKDQVMQYLRCKCGKAEAWTSGMAMSDCQGCEECGTTYGYSPSDHKPLIPHDLKPQFNRNTGEPAGQICARCRHRVKS